MKKRLEEALARELAVKASVDPKTIRKAYEGGAVRGMAGHRARAALKDFGLLESEKDAEPPRSR